MIVSTLGVMAQQKSSVETRALQQELRQAKGAEMVSEQFLSRYPIHEGLQGKEIGVIAKVDGRFDREAARAMGIRTGSQIADIVTLRVPLNRLQDLEQLSGIVQYTVAHKVYPLMEKTKVDTRTDSVQAGYGLPQGYNGKDVIIGITDWGFDYTHPNINKSNNQKILRAWDHYRNAGPAPEGFDYGTEIVGYEALKEAACDTFGLYGYGTHGTHVAGICAGAGVNGKYVGQAPKANLLLGSWLLDEASWLDQVAWMRRVAKEEGKRLVINSSWGMYTFSTIDGTSLLSQAVNHYSDSGTVFVTSGGNNGDPTYHLERTFGTNDTLKSIATYYSNGVGQALIYWGMPGEQFQAGFALVKNATQEVFPGPMFGTAENIDYREGYIVAGNDTIGYNIMTESANPFDQRPHALLNVDKKTGYKLMMLCTAESGSTVHIWNVCNLENHAGNIGCDFVNGNVYGCQPGDTRYGIGEPACADKCITVAAHSADYWKDDTTYLEGNLTYFSSRGPRFGGGNKPEISAPGAGVISSISSYTSEHYEAVYATSQNGRMYKFAGMSGTSMSGPAVTGIVALMLQANPNLTADQIREILFTTARNDSMTGALRANDSISPEWGYGKADALKAVNAAIDKLSIEEAVENDLPLTLYPNPADECVTLVVNTNEPAKGCIYSADGRELMRFTMQAETTLNIGALPHGVYVVRVMTRTGVKTAKFVK